jgi:threonine/homoserine/homoserine lactone efflux protein
MFDVTLFPVFLAGAIALALAPGPDMAFTLATAASRGPRAALGAVAGIITGGAIWTLAAAFGLAALVATSEHALTVIRYGGAMYLLWLAWRTFSTLDGTPKGHASQNAWRAFQRGLTTNLLNPKIGVFFLAFLPQFTNAEIGPVWLQMLTLGGIFFAIGTSILIMVALAAGAAQHKLTTSRRWRRALNGIAATAFGALGLRLLFAGETA